MRTCLSNDAFLCAWCSDYFDCLTSGLLRAASTCVEINLIDPFWLAVIGTSVLAFLLKYLGHNVPKSWLSNPRILKINSLIPIALLSALVAVQTFTKDSQLIADQRLAGVGVAVLALILRAPFPIVVISAAATSAALFHLN